MKKIKQWFMGLSVKQLIVAIAIAFVVIVAIGLLNSDDASKVEPTPTPSSTTVVDVTPTGWEQASYDGVVDGGYLYNRSHLIGFQLTGENANARNLITGTRQFNTEGMLPFENMVADYVKETGNHVLYRVTPSSI